MTPMPLPETTKDSTESTASQVVLSPEQERAWSDTMSLMAWTCPGFRHLFFKLLAETHNRGETKHAAVFTRDVPIAATDGQNILLNPDTFFKLGPRQRVYVVAHEVVHVMRGDVELLHLFTSSGVIPMHDGTTLPFVNETLQISMDAVINSLLDSSRIGARADMLDGKPCGHFDDDVLPDASVYDVYKKYYKKRKDKDPDGCGPGGKQGFDKVLPPGISAPGQGGTTPQRDPQQWAVEIMIAQGLEKQRGDMPGALERLFKSILEPEVDWRDHIATEITRTVGDGGYDWCVPDPWFAGLEIYSPSPTGTGAGTIIVWGDTSGSRNDQEIASNIGELSGILEDVKPQRLVVLWCDAAIAGVDELTDASELRGLKPKGGGGTSLEPVWKWIKENTMGNIDLFIGFTDGEVGFPDRAPAFPVIWASSTDHQYPFGKVVRVNKKGGNR